MTSAGFQRLSSWHGGHTGLSL
uniref:HMA2 n=1 Tax=Arundo donax TaxID=35708 RepID=A0A0A9GVP7_ARUDO